MDTGALGRTYEDGEHIFSQGELSDCMYVIQAGRVEVYLEKDGKEVSLTLFREGDFLGDSAFFQGCSGNERAILGKFQGVNHR